MSSVGDAADTDTLAGTCSLNFEDEEFNPYEESIGDDETIVGSETKTVKSKEESDANSLMLVKAEAISRYQTFSGPSSTPRPTFLRVIGGFATLPSRAISSVGSFAQRMLALCNPETQVRGAVLANAAVIQRRVTQTGKLASTSRNLLADIGPKQRAARDKIRSIRTALQNAKSRSTSAPLGIYIDLLLLLCTILRAPAYTYSESFVWRVWDTLTEELVGRDVHLVAEAMSCEHCMDEDIGTLLRHLALARLTGWKKQRPHNSSDIASIFGVLRSASFSSETYDQYVSLNEGFFTILLTLLNRRPTAVREAFADYAQLVWFKYAVPDPGAGPSQLASIQFSYVLDGVAHALSHWEKLRLDPCLSREARSYICFLASSSMCPEKRSLCEHLVPAATHIRRTLACIASASKSLPSFPPRNNHEPYHDCFNTDAIFELMREHPSFALGHLTHPALPPLLMTAELVTQSPRACIPLLDNSDGNPPHGIMGSLRLLWMRSFLLPWDYMGGTWAGTGAGPGRWVHKDKRSYQMRLATCFFLASLSKAADRAQKQGDDEPMRLLAESVTARTKVEAWFWEAAGITLYFSIHFSELYLKNVRSEIPPTREKQIETEIYGLYAHTLEQIRPLIAYLIHELDRKPVAPGPGVDDMTPESLVWLLEDVPPSLGCKALSSVLTRSFASRDWSVALTILSTCDSSNQDYFRAAISRFMHVLHTRRLPAPRPRSYAPVSPTAPDEPPREAPPLFMPHPADRFLMLLASAYRRNRHIGIALRRDEKTRKYTMQLLRDVEGGYFDFVADVDGRSPSPLDTEQREWRARTCRALWDILDE